MDYDDGRGWDMHDGMGWAGWLMMTSVLVVCLVVAGVLVYLVVRSTTTSPGAGAGGAVSERSRSTALRTLDERFARGEIDLPEYQERRRALEGG